MAEDPDQKSREYRELLEASLGEARLDAEVRSPEVFAFVQELQRLALSAEAWRSGSFVAPPGIEDVGQRVTEAKLSEPQRRFLLILCGCLCDSAAAIPRAAMADFCALLTALHDNQPHAPADPETSWQSCLSHLEQTEDPHAALWLNVTLNLLLSAF